MFVLVIIHGDETTLLLPAQPQIIARPDLVAVNFASPSYITTTTARTCIVHVNIIRTIEPSKGVSFTVISYNTNRHWIAHYTGYRYVVFMLRGSVKYFT